MGAKRQHNKIGQNKKKDRDRPNDRKTSREWLATSSLERRGQEKGDRKRKKKSESKSKNDFSLRPDLWVLKSPRKGHEGVSKQRVVHNNGNKAAFRSRNEVLRRVALVQA